MFLQCNLVQQFHIPYDVSETTICAVGPVDRQPNNSPRNIHRLGAVPMDAECEEELSTGEVPQLAACAECGPNDVRHDENRENGEIYDWFGNIRIAGGVLVSRSGPSRHQ